MAQISWPGLWLVAPWHSSVVSTNGWTLAVL